jgi:phage regulator Rha-like protein
MDLIKIHNQGTDLLADSREIAELFQVTHQHLRELIDDHEEQLSQLGVFRVETTSVQNRKLKNPP